MFGSIKVDVIVLAATVFVGLEVAVTCPLLPPLGVLNAGETPANTDAPGASCVVVTVPSLTLYTPAILSDLLVATLLTVLLTVVTLVTMGTRLDELMEDNAANGSLVLNIAYFDNGFNGLLLLTESPVTMPLLARVLRVFRTDYGIFTVVLVVVLVWVLLP